MSSFNLLYTPQAHKGIKKLPKKLISIAEKTFRKLAQDPYTGKPLVGKLKGIRSTRITRRYRVLYIVNDNRKEIVILDVKHRKEAYG